jgi:putative membrane protein
LVFSASTIGVIKLPVTPSDVRRDSALARVIIGVLSFVVALAVAVATYLLPKPTAHATPAGLATLNAALNAGAGILLVLGFLCIRRGKVLWHKRFMLSAFVLSSLFLVTYLLHHAEVGSVRFQGEGLLRGVYYGILIPHIVLAAVIVPLALFTIYRGLSGRFETHRRIARITFPIWLYVSVSGVLVYFMLYHL